MQRNDAIFNWLQIQIVREARPKDRSAEDTALFFEELLKQDHQMVSISKQFQDGEYKVTIQLENDEQKHTFPQESAEKLYQDILAEPKYNQSFEED